MNASREPPAFVAARLLVVEHDEILRRRLCEYLDAYAFAAVGVATLSDARELLKRHGFDVVTLDLNVGADDGLTLLRELVADNGPLVIITSRRAEETDRVAALEVGAADYLVKPFSFRELVARVRGLLRRQAGPRRMPSGRRIAKFDRWTIDLRAHLATDDSGRGIDLTVGELGLLRAFLEHPHRALVRHELMALTRRDDAVVFPRTIDVLVARLRRKLERNPRKPTILRTIRGAGYRFEPDVTWETVCD